MLSVVIPAYCSSKSLPILLDRLELVLSSEGLTYEVIIVDDCSPDDTWSILKKLKQTRSWLKIIRLVRNSGQHNALLCGFSNARGEIIVTLDDDLQNVPEDIPSLISAIDSGNDIAVGAYLNKKHSIFRNCAGNLIDGIQRRIFGLPKDFQLTSFRAIRRVVIDNVIAMSATFPYITSMLLAHSSRRVNVNVKHFPREFGKSNYTVSNSLKLALNLLLNYSSYPLYFVVILCVIALCITFMLSGWVAWIIFTRGDPVPGWASTITALSFFNGLILLALVTQSFYLFRLTQQITGSRVGFTIGELFE